MSFKQRVDQQLAILGGPKAVDLDQAQHARMFKWPRVTHDDEQAVLEVLRDGSRMSGTDITKQFEAEYARYQGVQYALGSCNGTAALLQAMFGVGLGRGDEMIVPSQTYWASALQCLLLGATPVFADVEPDTLCLDPNDIEHRISDRTKAIMVVHYCGHPVDMDPIMAIANKHGLKVIEDVSHAHGSLYKGKMVGSIGHVAAMSMMAGKSFAIGEAGMLVTDDRAIYERAIAYGCYERCLTELTIPEIRAMSVDEKRNLPLPLGAMKGRMNQLCSAMGRVQLRHYPQRIAEIQKAMNHFWDLLEDTPGLKAHRPDAAKMPDSTMGGWYNPIGHYLPEQLDGLPLERFLEAVQAEGAQAGRGVNIPLHLHPLLHQADVFGDGKPTALAFAQRDVRQGAGSLPVTESLLERCYGIPWLKWYEPSLIEQQAAAFRKVALQADKLVQHA